MVIELRNNYGKEENIEKYKIKDYIKPNQMLLLQVKKDSTGTKGARVSTNIQIPGRFVVILPENDFITVSQKVEAEEEKNRLIDIVKKIKADKKIKKKMLFITIIVM